MTIARDEVECSAVDIVGPEDLGELVEVDDQVGETGRRPGADRGFEFERELVVAVPEPVAQHGGASPSELGGAVDLLGNGDQQAVARQLEVAVQFNALDRGHHRRPIVLCDGGA